MRFGKALRSANLRVAAVLLLPLICGLATAQEGTQLKVATDEGSAISPQPAAPQIGSTIEEPPIVAVEPNVEEVAAEEQPQPPAKPTEEALRPIPDSLEADPVVEVASFKDVAPGKTPVAEMEKQWGPPKEVQKQADTLIHLYSIEPFERVEVTSFNGKVTAITIRLDRAFPAATVAQQLNLTDIRPVLVSDELGEILGQSYPERGVLFAFVPSKEPGKMSMQVGHVVLEPIDAEPFVLRAETTLKSRYDLSAKDLKHALKIQPNNARAHWLNSRILTAMGDCREAVGASGRAVQLEPGDAAYRVTHAQVLGQIGRMKEAVEQAEQAVATSQQRPHVKARALCLLGDLKTSGLKPDYKQALQYHTAAVREADRLVSSRHPAIRITAKEVLIDAHLGAAHDIAWGDWKGKEKAVRSWLSQAGALVEDLIQNDGGNQEYRFRVNTRALAACVGMRGDADPTEWSKQAVRLGQELIAGSEDPVRKAKYEWDLGMALYDALQVYQMRGDHETALKYGEWAIEHLERGEQQKQAPTSAYLLGRLYFRLGAIHAIRDKNHKTAITWFDKATPLLKRPIPKEAFSDLGRHGETFVSMGVSYWESGKRETAVELTSHGVEVMQKAVKIGALEESELAIPYSNLSSMNSQLGKHKEAARYESMAKKIEDTIIMR